MPAQSPVYNGENTFTVEIEGVNGETITVTLTVGSADAGEYTYTTDEFPGETSYTATYQNSNYTLIDGELLTIRKANPTYTKPDACHTVYNGKPQILVTSGSAQGGEMQYSLSEEGPYSTTLPAGIDTGKYTVWFRVVGDHNHNDIAPQSVTVYIYPEDITPTDPTDPRKPVDNVAPTGDNSNFALWMALTVLSLAGIVVTLCSQKKKRLFSFSGRHTK